MINRKKIRVIWASPLSPQNGKNVIGKDGDMPWRGLVNSDMKRFVTLTKKGSVLMGRKTWDSIPETYRPFDKKLPLKEARQSVVITRDQNFKVDDPRVTVAHSLKEAIELAKFERVWIIGGAQIYSLALPLADFMHKTVIWGKFEGDTFFPPYNQADWKCVHSEHLKAGGIGAETDRVNSSYLVYQRIAE